MTKQYGFYVDTSACSGCKVCQVACKDKHDLEEGVLWRRVYEVSGGDWREEAGAWISGVFAYNVSVACNHCENPVCLSACPAGAIGRREDGIVLIDREKCIGCRYCEWVCPYGAPQYDKRSGTMTKCHFCFDYIDQGKAPACVAACPMRVLDFGELSELRAKYGHTGEIYPLPKATYTRPALVVKSHRDAVRAWNEKAYVANKEEV
jgi:anaerobic dimethyl sulfoxide reductase subunit B (iron-sulfur subunit)